ncbi:uncharacterized protein C8Q71DRAFT_185271 [Rhodofomes roseus]|uniref:Uncharacterized protein n=1 Tax=Rhodofomes roseus TaxID=34475 RepID=A0ABQ8K859_9APHY|nr:uncharacterized protein C8Q71DRAFT_185271 [Rhodofomes roseus]KAH9833477.1 hypothetical protein C8Q71DRAFT_185271 [Rhodofomes roseus]
MTVAVNDSDACGLEAGHRRLQVNVKRWSRRPPPSSRPRTSVSNPYCEYTRRYNRSTGGLQNDLVTLIAGIIADKRNVRVVLTHPRWVIQGPSCRPTCLQLPSLPIPPPLSSSGGSPVGRCRTSRPRLCVRGDDCYTYAWHVSPSRIGHLTGALRPAPPSTYPFTLPHAAATNRFAVVSGEYKTFEADSHALGTSSVGHRFMPVLGNLCASVRYATPPAALRLQPDVGNDMTVRLCREIFASRNECSLDIGW